MARRCSVSSVLCIQWRLVVNIHFDPCTHCLLEIHPNTGPCFAQWMMTPGLGNTSHVLLSLLLVTSVPVLAGDSSSCDTTECGGEGEGARSENIWTQHQEQEQEQEQQEAGPGDMARVALVLGASGETGKVISNSY